MIIYLIFTQKCTLLLTVKADPNQPSQLKLSPSSEQVLSSSKMIAGDTIERIKVQILDLQGIWKESLTHQCNSLVCILDKKYTCEKFDEESKYFYFENVKLPTKTGKFTLKIQLNHLKSPPPLIVNLEVVNGKFEEEST